MKCATTITMLLLGATASCCQAFFVATRQPISTTSSTMTTTTTTTTALPVYHYLNGPDPDPSSKGPKPEEKKGVKPVFPAYGIPEAKASLSDKEVVESDKKKGLNPVFLDWEDRGFSADGLQRPSN